jgi:hypothetical protein
MDNPYGASVETLIISEETVNMGLILQEMEDEKHPKGKHITYCSTNYKSY